MLSLKKQRALESLLVASSRRAAAEAAGVDIKTLRGYLNDPEFSAAYKAAFAEKVEEATRQAQSALAPALATLLEICQDESAGHMARISASRALLEFGMRLGEEYDYAVRIAALEKAAAEDA